MAYLIYPAVFLLSVMLISAEPKKNNIAVASRNEREAPAMFPFKLRIVTLENAPYTTISQGANGIEYKGFIPDLIYKMSQRLHFDYEFYKSPDGRYGARQADGQWNGMIGELIRRKYTPDGNLSESSSNIGADVVAAPLTMTSVREEVVDFAKPFHHLGLTVVVQKSYMVDNTTNEWPIDFSIFKPLTPGVWALIFVIVVVVGILLALMNHFNPYEWKARYNMGLAKEYQKDTFSISGSAWFVFTTLQWQGFERAPRSISAKVLTGFWFCFVTLTLVTYIGALVNHLWWASMIQRHNPSRHPIRDLADLVSGDFRDFKVGCPKGGSTYRYVTEVAAPRLSEFKSIADYWKTKEGSKQLASTTSEGLQKIRSEKYAFIMETMSARYIMNQKPCDLTTIGDQFGLRSYGLAMPKGSPFLEPFHKAILELNEEGEIDDLEQKWWEGQGECWNITNLEKTMDKATAMYVNQAQPKTVDLNMFWGVIVAMVIGMIISILVAVAEIVYYRYRGRLYLYTTPLFYSQHEDSNRSKLHALPKLENDDGNI